MNLITPIGHRTPLDIYSEQALSFANLKDREYNLRHAVRGLITESAELVDADKRAVIYEKALDVLNIKEEIGDCMWYVALICHAEGLKIESPRDYSTALDPKQTLFSAAVALAALCGAAGVMVDQITTAGNPEPRGSLHQVVLLIVGGLDIIAEMNGFTLIECCDANTAKLRVRYKNGFSTTSALNRNLDAEKAALSA